VNSGNLSLDSESIDICSLVNSVARTFGHQANRKGVNFTVYVTGDIPVFVKGDRRRLEEMFNNVVGMNMKTI
jgi:signal transduction histidine kinase